MGKKTKEIIVRLDAEEFARVTGCFERQSEHIALAAFAREKLVATCGPDAPTNATDFNADRFKRQVLFIVTILHPDLGPDEIESLYRENVEHNPPDVPVPEFIHNLLMTDGVA